MTTTAFGIVLLVMGAIFLVPTIGLCIKAIKNRNQFFIPFIVALAAITALLFIFGAKFTGYKSYVKNEVSQECEEFIDTLDKSTNRYTIKSIDYEIKRIEITGLGTNSCQIDVVWTINAESDMTDTELAKYFYNILDPYSVFPSEINISKNKTAYLLYGISKTTVIVNGTTYNKPENKVNSSFTNDYGTPSTTCMKSGCNNKIASSGDTAYCTSHSGRCLNCRCYVDPDAMYCMDCLRSALD